MLSKDMQNHFPKSFTERFQKNLRITVQGSHARVTGSSFPIHLSDSCSFELGLVIFLACHGYGVPS